MSLTALAAKLPSVVEDETKVCPDCKRTMVLRQNYKGHYFWGCTGFPRYCKKIVPYKLPPREVPLSNYQKDIILHVCTQQTNLVVRAGPGSAKTTTSEIAMRYIPVYEAVWDGKFSPTTFEEVEDYRLSNSPHTTFKVAFVAFTQEIAHELSLRMPDFVRTSTIHSLAFSNCRAHYGNRLKVDEWKNWNIYRKYKEEQGLLGVDVENLDKYAHTITELASLMKSYMLPLNFNSIDWLATRMGKYIDDDPGGISMAVIEIIKRGHEQIVQDLRVDFDDMVYLCATGVVPCEQFDVIGVDEGQDLNRAQRDFVVKSLTLRGKALVVGDEKQAIFGFAGADPESLDQMIYELMADVLPLPICYRSAKKIIDYAREIYTDIEYAPDAIEGEVAEVQWADFYAKVKPGDAVLCRVTHALIAPIYDLIRKGIKAGILGYKLMENFNKLLDEAQGFANSKDLKEVLRSLDAMIEERIDKAKAKRKYLQAALLEDDCQTLHELAKECTTVSQVKMKIKEIFTTEGNAIIGATLHRAKGKEWDTVYIIRPDLLPHPRASREWELQQEKNMDFVGRTRARKALYIVQEPNKEKKEM